MKKVLFASTALALTAGVASANDNISFSASALLYGSYTEGAADEFVLEYNFDLNINAETTTDNGVRAFASIDLDLDHDECNSTMTDTIVTGTGTAPASASTSTTPGVGCFGGASDLEVGVANDYVTITVGGVDVATDGIGFADVGVDGALGVDNDAESGKTIGSADVNANIKFGDISVVASLHTVNEDSAIALFYSQDMFNVGIGFANDNDGGDAVAAEAGVSFGDIAVNVFAQQTDGSTVPGAGADTNGMGFDVQYSDGPLTVVFAYGSTDVAGDPDDYGIGVDYSLGGGVTLAGGVARVDDTTVANLGLEMSF